MCGIIAYAGKRSAVPILLGGLKSLEYRGYDSAGISVAVRDRLSTVKRKGRVSELENDQEIKKLKDSPDAVVGIAHTRWATHGEPSETNAHPHLDCRGEIAVVHNGIIENFHALRDLLEKESHIFSTQTDSEVIAHLVEKFFDGDLEDAVFKAIRCLEGAFGIAVLHRSKQEVVAARRGSPLIIGIGDNEMFAASDAVAIPVRKVIYLNDNEVAVIRAGSYSIKNLDGSSVDGEICQIRQSSEQLEKKGFRHFMLKEIFEQPESVGNTLRGRLKGDSVKLTLDIDPCAVKRVIIAACGTSWHSALIGKHLIERIAGLPAEVDYASEFRYRNPLLKETDLFVAISQSGETADTYAALKEAKERGAKAIGIVNVVGSTIAREAGSGIYLHAGPEIGVASTKAFTSQVVSLVLLASHLRKQRGGVLDSRLMGELAALPEKISESLKQSDRIKEIAKQFRDSKNFLYLGRGVNFPVALEGALKLKEISYIHAEGYPAAEMKHGPIALIDREMPVVFIATKDSLYHKILSNMQEVKARGGRIIAVVNEEDEEIKKLADYVIRVPRVADELSPIINVIPLQLLAYYIADLKGLDVDKPRNLAKSVTVE